MRVYSLDVEATSYTAGAAAKTMIAFATPATMMAVILRASISQVLSEVSEEVTVELRRLSAAGNGTATSVTAANTARSEVGDPDPTFTDLAAAAGYSTNFSAEPTTYNNRANYPDSFNVLNGWVYVPAPEERIWVPPSARIGLRFNPSAQTIGQNLTFNACLVIGMVG